MPWCGDRAAGDPPPGCGWGRLPGPARGVRETTGLEILAWPLLPNDVHLLVRPGPRPLARALGVSLRSVLRGVEREARLLAARGAGPAALLRNL